MFFESWTHVLHDAQEFEAKQPSYTSECLNYEEPYAGLYLAYENTGVLIKNTRDIPIFIHQNVMVLVFVSHGHECAEGLIALLLAIPLLGVHDLGPQFTYG